MPFDSAPAPTSTARQERRARTIGHWLLVVAGMVWAMVALGGLTRLTGSGLSIMEWAPISGSLPPLSAAEWQRLYDLYRSIPQYALVNPGMDVEGFRGIFWLEWAHRAWGRAIGLAYALPLAWFWLRGRVPAGLKPRLLLLLLLGGLQGAVGWFMVASGFAADRTAVAPLRLVLHLGLAFTLYAALLWTALGLLRPAPAPDPAESVWARPMRRVVAGAGVLLGMAMLVGGCVAGLRAGLDYNTFPLMDGQWIPADYAAIKPFVRNLTENVATVQFHHRVLATLAGVAALGAALLAWGRLPAGAARRACLALGAATLLQYVIGVMTLLLVVPIWAGTLHQAAAVLVLTTALLALHTLRPPPPAAHATPRRRHLALRLVR